MSIYNIIQDTKYFTLNEARKEIQNILNNNTQSIDTFILMESINKSLSNKKNNVKNIMSLSIFIRCNKR